jgi:hypothetical protein
MEDDNPIFKGPYRLSEMERTLVQARTTELLDPGLVEPSRGDYVLTTMMLAKKDIFGNWMEWCMCGDWPNRQMHMSGQICHAFTKRNI